MLTLQDARGWLLVALALLSLLAFAWRRRARRVVLAPFYLLRALAERLPAAPRWYRLRRRLQWFFLAAALFAIALAGLRPRYLSGAAAVRELAIVDLSPSQGVLDGGRPRLKTLRSRLRAYLGLLQAQDTVVFVTAGARPAASAPLAGGRAAQAWLERLDWVDARVDVDGAVRLASGLLADTKYDHVLLFTDRPARWAGTGIAAFSPRIISFGGRVANAGIDAFDLQAAASGFAGYDLFLRVSCAGGAGTDGGRPLTLTLTNNGRAVRQVERSCASGAPIELLLEGIALEPGEAVLTLTPGDAYPPDDRVSVGIGDGAAAKVVVVTAGNRFLETAVRAGAPREVLVVAPDGQVPRDPAAVYVIDGRVPAGDLPDRALFIMPDRPPEGLAVQTYLSFPSQIEAERGDPLLRHADLDALSVRGYYAFDADPAYRAALRGDGRPLLLRRADGGRRWVVLAFDPSESNLVYAPAYPIFIANSIRWLSRMGSDEQAFFKAGAPVFLPAAACGGEVHTPDGRAVALAPPCNPRLSPLELSHPGRYEVRSAAGGPLGVFHANVVDPAVTAEIGAAGYGPAAGALPDDLARGPLRVDLAPWLALVALACVAAERLLAPRLKSVLLR